MRSKILLITNILASLWSVCLLIYVGNFLVSGGWEVFVSANVLADVLSEFVDGINAIAVVDAIMMLLLVHIVLFTFGAILGWVGFCSKKSGCAKIAAIFYLLATILFPFFILISFLIIILAFIGQSNQKKLSVL